MVDSRDRDYEVVVRLRQVVGQYVAGDPGDVGGGTCPSAGDDGVVRVDADDLWDLLGESNRQKPVTGTDIKSGACSRWCGVQCEVVVVDVVVPYVSFLGHLTTVSCGRGRVPSCSQVVDAQELSRTTCLLPGRPSRSTDRLRLVSLTEIQQRLWLRERVTADAQLIRLCSREIGLGQYLDQVAGRVFEVDASTVVMVIDPALLG